MTTESLAGVDRRSVEAAPKGVVAPAAAEKKFRLARYYPSADLAGFVEHYWIVVWDLTGQEPYLQRTLTYPCVNLVFDAGRTAIFGPKRGVFEYRLENHGRAFGVRFRPAGFRGLSRSPLSRIADRTLPLEAIYPIDGPTAEMSLLAAADDEGMMAAAESILRRRIPAPDSAADLANSVVERIERDREITRTDALACEMGLNRRALQRLFANYVGVSPKWTIRRFRLQEAAYRLGRGETLDLAGLAQELGYFDQAHFAGEFKKFVGQAPSQYRRASA